MARFRRDRIIVDQRGKRHEIPQPRWFDGLNQVEASPDGRYLLYTGWGASTRDTARVDVVPTAGGDPQTWARFYSPGAGSGWLADGAIVFQQWARPDVVTIHKLLGPGRDSVVGTVGHLAVGLTVSRDLKRATLARQESRGDAWLYRVVQ